MHEESGGPLVPPTLVPKAADNAGIVIKNLGRSIVCTVELSLQISTKVLVCWDRYHRRASWTGHGFLELQLESNAPQ